MLLYPGQSCWVGDGGEKIIGGIRLSIVGWVRRCDGHENREARFVYKEDKMFLDLIRSLS